MVNVLELCISIEKCLYTVLECLYTVYRQFGRLLCVKSFHVIMIIHVNILRAIRAKKREELEGGIMIRS